MFMFLLMLMLMPIFMFIFMFILYLCLFLFLCLYLQMVVYGERWASSDSQCHFKEGVSSSSSSSLQNYHNPHNFYINHNYHDLRVHQNHHHKVLFMEIIYSHNFHETSWQYGTTWNIEQLEKYKGRKNPGDDIWLQAWQPTSVLIAMEHRGKTTPLPQTYLPKFSFQTERDAGWKYGRPVQKDWSWQVHGRLLRAACPPS